MLGLVPARDKQRQAGVGAGRGRGGCLGVGEATQRLEVVSGVWRSEDTRRICLGSRDQDFEGDSGHATPV